MKLIADSTVPYLKGIAEPVMDVTYLEAAAFTPDAIHDADALLIRSIDKCTRELLEGSRVKLITSATIGFDHIDTRYCDEAGIVWKNAPGCNAGAVAQYILCSLITLAMRKQTTLQGKTIGIVGVGHVGSAVEAVCKSWGMQVLRNDPPRAEQEGNAGFVSLDAIAREADIITLHVPFTREGNHPTYHLADDAFFDSLQKKPWFINASRGAVHDTAALLAAVKNGKTGGLILDCWENEPAISSDLLAVTDLATPHIAGFSADGKANGTRMCLENIAAFFGVKFDKIGEVTPPPPVQAHINLADFDENRLQLAVLHTYNPALIDHDLRRSPNRFEYFRNHYHYPREFKAFTVVNASDKESELLAQLGFKIG